MHITTSLFSGKYVTQHLNRQVCMFRLSSGMTQLEFGMVTRRVGPMNAPSCVLISLPSDAPLQAAERVGDGQLPLPAGIDAHLHRRHPAHFPGGRGPPHGGLLLHPEGDPLLCINGTSLEEDCQRNDY